MRNAHLRITTIAVLLCGALILAPNSWAQERAPILDQIAKTYGIDSWDKVEAIRYTWNGEIPGLFKAAHKWEWEPKTGKITYCEYVPEVGQHPNYEKAMEALKAVAG